MWFAASFANIMAWILILMAEQLWLWFHSIDEEGRVQKGDFLGLWWNVSQNNNNPPPEVSYLSVRDCLYLHRSSVPWTSKNKIVWDWTSERCWNCICTFILLHPPPRTFASVPKLLTSFFFLIPQLLWLGRNTSSLRQPALGLKSNLIYRNWLVIFSHIPEISARTH